MSTVQLSFLVLDRVYYYCGSTSWDLYVSAFIMFDERVI